MAWKKRIKAGLEGIRGTRGPEAAASLRPSKARSVALLAACGLRPGTVFDVGVHRSGTPELYRSFPDAKHVLIEPVREFEDDIARLAAGIRDVDLIWAAASNREGTGRLGTTDGLTHSFLGQPDDAPGSREVDVVTLDGLRREHGYAGPYLVKVDVDGPDLDVLEGASDVLRETACVIIESTAWEIPRRCRFLAERGFHLWDMVDFLYYEERLWQVDLVFVSAELAGAAAFCPWADGVEGLDGAWKPL